MGECRKERGDLMEGSRGVFGVGGTGVQTPAPPLFNHVPLGGLPDLLTFLGLHSLIREMGTSNCLLGPLRELDKLVNVMFPCSTGNMLRAGRTVVIP